VLVVGWLSRHVWSVHLPKAQKWLSGLFGPHLHFVYQRYRRSKAGWGNQPATGIMIDFWVTSSYDRPVAIFRGELRYWQGWRRRTFSRIQLETPLLPGRPTELRALFPVTPPPVPDDKPFTASVFFIDNYSKRHRAGKFTFVSREPGDVLPPD
jgi:hypothetical protein